MLSLASLHKHYRSGHLAPLLDQLAGGGLELPVPLRVRLADQPATLIALALKRLGETTYTITPLASQLLHDLLQRMEQDITLGHDPLAMAAALAALNLWLREQPLSPELEARTCLLREQTLSHMISYQDASGLLGAAHDRAPQQRALVSSYILFLLSDDDQFRQAIRWAELLDQLETQQAQFEPATATLWRLARLSTLPLRTLPVAA